MGLAISSINRKSLCSLWSSRFHGDGAHSSPAHGWIFAADTRRIVVYHSAKCPAPQISLVNTRWVDACGLIPLPLCWYPPPLVSTDSYSWYINFIFWMFTTKHYKLGRRTSGGLDDAVLIFRGKANVKFLSAKISLPHFLLARIPPITGWLEHRRFINWMFKLADFCSELLTNRSNQTIWWKDVKCRFGTKFWISLNIRGDSVIDQDRTRKQNRIRSDLHCDKFCLESEESIWTWMRNVHR